MAGGGRGRGGLEEEEEEDLEKPVPSGSYVRARVNGDSAGGRPRREGRGRVVKGCT